MIDLPFWAKGCLVTKEGQEVAIEKIHKRMKRHLGEIVLVQSVCTENIRDSEYALPIISQGSFRWDEGFEEEGEAPDPFLFTTSPGWPPYENVLDSYISFKKNNLRPNSSTGVARIVDSRRRRIYEDTALAKQWAKGFGELRGYLRRITEQGEDPGDEKDFFKAFETYSFERMPLLDTYGVSPIWGAVRLVENIRAEERETQKRIKEKIV